MVLCTRHMPFGPGDERARRAPSALHDQPPDVLAAALHRTVILRRHIGVEVGKTMGQTGEKEHYILRPLFRALIIVSLVCNLEEYLADADFSTQVAYLARTGYHTGLSARIMLRSLSLGGELLPGAACKGSETMFVSTTLKAALDSVLQLDEREQSAMGRREAQVINDRTIIQDLMKQATDWRWERPETTGLSSARAATDEFPKFPAAHSWVEYAHRDLVGGARYTDTMSSPVAPASDGKDKSSRKERVSKKRHRETTDNTEASERKHKKSKGRVSLGDGDGVAADQPKSSAPALPAAGEVGADRKRSQKYKKAGLAIDEEPKAGVADDDGKHKGKSGKQLGRGVQDDAPSKEKKKSKKDKRRNDTQEGETAAADVDVAQAAVIPDSQEAPSSQQKKKKKEKRKEKHREAVQPEPMDIDPAPSQLTPAKPQAHGDRPDVSFPFFTQTVSQYLPLFPSGMVEPIEGYAEQHLRPLLNRYVPAFRGVLLSYRNPRIGEAPGKGSLTEASQMEDTALLESIDEYAVGFSWLTVEADLFCPKRGSWMEGSLNLQSEGFIGVICFGMFNASIEASRLPSGWKWVDLLSKKGGKQQNGKSAAEAKLPTPEPQDENGEEDDGTNQAHSTGYWVDESGSKVGGKLRFRIKNYEVGSVGDYGYLSIEGTMLDEEAERAKVTEEMEAERRRKLKHSGLLRKPFKRLPEFSMTKFGKDGEQEDDILRSNKSKSNRPGTVASE
ncbi:hypothetical protein DL771_003175 [Monosporascus sp. 5C6A]|nr:hypothetical protein DL771_003175 [Monosporascus sp. 5C6A]